MNTKPHTSQNKNRKRVSQKPAKPMSASSEMLTLSDEWLKTVYIESPIGIELYDADGILLDANPACLRIFGVGDVSQVKGFKLFDDPNLPKEAKTRLKRGKTVRYEAPFDFELVKELHLYETSMSGTIYLDVLLTPSGAGKGTNPKGYLVQVQDITTRKKVEEAQRQSADELAALQSIALDLAAQKELLPLLDTIVERASALLKAPCGFIYLYDPKANELELVVEHGLFVSPGLHLKMGEGMAGQVARTRQPLIVDDYSSWEGRSPQYEAVPYHSIVEVPILFSGQLIGVLGVNDNPQVTRKFEEADARLLSLFAAQAASAVRNARLLQGLQDELAGRKRTEQALIEAEERYRALFEQSPDGILLIDPNTELPILFNSASHTILGYSHEEFAHLRISDYEVVENPRETKAHIKKILQQGRDDFDTKHRTKQGEIRDIQVTVQRITLAGHPVFNCIYRDITERKRAEEELREHARQIETLQQVGLELTAELNLDALLHSIVLHAIEMMKGNRGGLYLYRPVRDVIEWTVSIGSISAPIGSILHRGEGLSGRVWKTGEPLIVADYRKWKGKATIFKDSDFRAVIGVPVCWGGEFLGVLNVGSNQPGLFSTADTQLLSLFASQAAIAMHNAQLYEAQQKEISDRKKAETAWGEAEARYRTLVEQITAVTYIDAVDEASTTLYISPQVEALSGYSADEWTSDQDLWTRLIHPDDRARVLAENLHTNETGEPFIVEYRIISRDGRVVWVHDEARLLKDETGMPQHWQGIMLDITERKRAEETLQKSEQTYKALIETTSTGYLIINSQGQVEDANAEYVRLSGNKTLQEILGRNVLEWTAPYDQQRNAIEVEKCAKTGIVRNLEIDYTDKNGVITPVEINATVVQTKKGQVILSLCRDITDRKRAEKVQKAVYGISQSAISKENINELYQSIHATLSELMPVENFYIALYDPTSDLLSFPYFVDQYDQPSPPIKPGRGLTEYVLRTGKPLLAPPNVFETLVQQNEVELVGTNSIDWLGVPLIVQDHVIGVMVTQSYKEGVRFSQQDATLLEFVSTQVAQAIEKTRLYAAEKRRAERFASIAQLGSEIATLHGTSDVLNMFLPRAAEIMESTTCTIMTVDSEKNEARLIAHAGLPPRTPPGYRVSLELPILRHFMETGEPLIIPNIDQNAPALRTVLVRQDIQSFFAYPMIRDEKVTGLITFSKLTTHSPSDEERAACQLLAERVAIALDNAQLFEETARSLEQVKALHTIDMTIASSFDLRLTLSILLEQTRARLGVDAVDILIYNPHTQSLDFASSLGFRTSALQGTHLRLGQGYAGIAGLERKTIRVLNLNEQKTDFLRSPNFSSEGFVSYFGVPLIAKGQIKGVLEILHRSPLHPDHVWLEFLETLAKQAAIAIDNATLLSELQSSNAELTLAYDSTLAGWSRALDLRDRDTEGHTQRVVEETVNLARLIGVDESELPNIRRGALLHDIGKMGIPDAILHKPGPLSAEEWAIMRQHPVYARDMLTPINYLRSARDIPYHHHEKWDGTGYPDGLKGEQIPLSARIFAVVDVYDALTSNRPYRTAWSPEKAIEHIRSQAGKHFDPHVMEVFLRKHGINSEGGN